jgi:hypothetical protein
MGVPDHIGLTESLSTASIANWSGESRSIVLHAIYLPGYLNIIADQESRGKADASDWKLSPKLFLAIAKRWPMTTDLFASAWNA